MVKPLIVLTGQPDWANTVIALLAEHQFDPVIYSDPDHYIEQVAEQYVALVLVDGDRDDWRFWVTSLKIEQATRRIPVLLVTRNIATAHAAIPAGADDILTPDDFASKLIPLIRDRARIPSPALLEELDCQCREDLPPLAWLGVEKFNAGAYYAQHDAFEEQWMHDPRPVRDLYQGILQIGVAYYHIQRGNTRGGLKMLRRSIQWLALLPDVCQGVNVKQLREDAALVRAALQAAGNGPFDTS
ncbi:MAG: DUF309 domain-containing protein, partial [Anaerolineae bacterium]|nr:DUF309 domain-containing protein [Anaerolineae bacterium]